MKKHPLINFKSPHYLVNGRQSIRDVEDALTVGEMIGFCKGNSMKYKIRNKGQDKEDSAKYITFQNYLIFLQDNILDDSDSWLSVTELFKKYDIELDYCEPKHA